MFHLIYPDFIKVDFLLQQGRNSKYATYIGVSCLYLVCSLMAIPIFFKFQLNPEQLSVNGQSKLSTTPFSKSSGYFMWEIWVHCWFLMALPLSVTVTVSFLILRQIKNSEQNHGGKKNMNMQITRMILKTVTFFVIRIAVQCIGQCLLLAFVVCIYISMTNHLCYILNINIVESFLFVCVLGGRGQCWWLAIA